MAMDTQSPPPETETVDISPTSELAQQVLEATGVNAMECYQCGKCSSGCPIAELTDVLPHDFWRMVQLGMTDRLFRSHHLWLCVACETCTTRCPNQLPLPKGNRFPAPARTTTIACRRRNRTSRPFTGRSWIRWEHHGRMHELSMIRKYKMATGDLFKDFKLGLKLLRQGARYICSPRTCPHGMKSGSYSRRTSDESGILSRLQRRGNRIGTGPVHTATCAACWMWNWRNYPTGAVAEPAAPIRSATN